MVNKIIYRKGNKYYWDSGKSIGKSEWTKIRNGRQPIPPAYTNVQIYPFHPKIWCKGKDVAGRQQVLYQPKFRQNQERLKFDELVKFGTVYPKIYKQILKDAPNNPVAMCLLLMVECSFRVGSKDTEHKGASTAQVKHLGKITKNSVDISFIGKKGVLNECTITNPELIKYFSKIKKDPNLTKNRPLFCDGTKKIRADDINKYLSQWGDFSSKYIRTWTANTELIKELRDNWKEYQSLKSESARKRFLNTLIDNVATQHHHTRAICKKSYLYPRLVETILDNKIKSQSINKAKNPDKYFLDFLKSKSK
jgi:DNA topoisomerase-1